MTKNMNPHTTKVDVIKTKAEPCKWCGSSTTILGVEECDLCWSLRVSLGKPTEMNIIVKMLGELREDVIEEIVTDRC